MWRATTSATPLQFHFGWAGTVASFGSSGTYESKLVIDWVTEEYDVDPEGDKLPTYWALLHETLTEGKPFIISDHDVLTIMRTISTVKAQNKYITK